QYLADHDPAADEITSDAGPVADEEDPARDTRTHAEPERIAIRGVRKAMAQAMVASAFSAPHVTEWITVDVTKTMRLADELRADPMYRDIKLTPLAFVARACVLGLQKFPL